MLCIRLLNAYLVIAHGLGVGRINSTHSRLLGFGAGVDNNGPDQARSYKTIGYYFTPSWHAVKDTRKGEKRRKLGCYSTLRRTRKTEKENGEQRGRNGGDEKGCQPEQV